MKDKIDIVVAGCGGQGVLTSTMIIANALFDSGYFVKQTESHGMSQRGGSVESLIRAGKTEVYSPKIMQGKADYLVGLEMLEAFRWVHYSNKDSLALVNTKKIEPVPVKLGMMEYPNNIPEEMKKVCKVILVDCSLELKNAGLNENNTNVYMAGMLSNYLGVEEKIWYNTLMERFKESLFDQALKAFKCGKSYIPSL